MCCDYYVQTDLVIVYIDSRNRFSKTITNRNLRKIYLHDIPDVDSDDDDESQQKKYKEELKKMIDKNNYKKNIYVNDQWVKKTYKKRYLKILPSLCPGIMKIVNIYKNYLAWERSLDLLEP
jgi:hypothetical protein